MARKDKQVIVKSNKNYGKCKDIVLQICIEKGKYKDSRLEVQLEAEMYAKLFGAGTRLQMTPVFYSAKPRKFEVFEYQLVF